MAIRQNDLTFRAGSDTLTGTLWLPESAGIHSAVLLVDGAGPTTRNDGANPELAAQLTDSGIAVFAWDKPGVGGSTGDWTQQDFEDRAQEALAAVGAVQTEHKAFDCRSKVVFYCSNRDGLNAPGRTTDSPIANLAARAPHVKAIATPCPEYPAAI